MTDTLPMAALGGVDGLGQAAAMAQGEHALYSETYRQFRNPPATFKNDLPTRHPLSGVSRAIVQESTEAQTLENSNIYWGTDRTEFLDVAPDMDKALPTLARKAVAGSALRQAEAAGLEQQLDELEASASPAEPGEESAPSADAEELRAALDRLTAEAERSG